MRWEEEGAQTKGIAKASEDEEKQSMIYPAASLVCIYSNQV